MLASYYTHARTHPLAPAGLGLKPVSEESLKNSYNVNNVGYSQKGVFRKPSDPNPNKELEKKYGYASQ